LETYPLFFTATIKDWKYLLKKDRNKDIILESLAFLTLCSAVITPRREKGR